MTAEMPLGVGLYMPEDEHVSRARWWLASHPGTRDRAAIAAGVRRQLPGLRHQDVAELMAEVMEGVGDWADPATWPATWPAEWATEAPVIVREVVPVAPVAPVAPVSTPAPVAAPEPPPVAVIVPAVPRPPAAPRVRARGAPRPSRAKGGAGRSLPGSDEAVPEPIAGVPQWDGHPVRASRIPRHLLPAELLHAAPAARWLLWRAAQPSAKPLTMDVLREECGAGRKAVQDWLAWLRAAGLMLTAYDLPARAPRPVRRTDWTPYATTRGPRPADYSKLVTAEGRRVVAQLPRHLTADIGRGYTDDSDMAVLDAIVRKARERQRTGRPPEWVRMPDLRLVPGCDGAPRACARLLASGAIEWDWSMRTHEVRLAPEVARAWGVGC